MTFVGSSKFLAVSLVFLLALFSFRLYNLDCDLPSWGISQYTSLDEGTYAAMAINKYNYGVVNCESLPVPSLTTEAHRNNLIGNVLTYCSLRVFGDNYFGLRFPSVLWSLGTLVLMAVILLKRLPFSPVRNLIVAAALAFPVMDFQFLIASRVVEPSVVRMFFITLLVAVLVVPRRSCLSLFAAGFIAVLSIMLVYVSTVFAGLPLAVLLVRLLKRKQYSYSASLVLGGLVSFAIGELYYHAVWHTSFFVNSLNSVVGFSHLNAYAASSDLLGVFENIQSILMNRCFVFSPFVLVLFVLSLPVIVAKFFRRQISVAHIILSFIVAYIFQTLFFNDYVMRKFIVVYPLVLLAVAFSAVDMINYWRDCYRRRVYLFFSRDCNLDVARGRWRHLGRFLVVGSIAASLMLAFLAVHLCIFDVVPIKYDFKVCGDRTILSLCILLPLMLALPLCWRPSNKRIIGAGMLIVVGWLFSSLFFSLKYVYLNRNYAERDFMRELGRKMGSNRLFGEWSYSYTLYNDVKPVEGDYQALIGAINSNRGGYLFNYESLWLDEKLVNAATANGLAMKADTKLRHSFRTFGKFRDHWIYRVEPFSGDKIPLAAYTKNHILNLGYVLPQDESGQLYLPREFNEFLESRTVHR